MATLYQVSGSIFNLFDRVTVIDGRKCVYYGRRGHACDYFEQLGYFSTPRQTTADFVTAVTDPNQVQYRKGFESRASRTSEDRERAWKESSLYKDLLAEIDAYEAVVQND